jgi:hypothetical protein
MAVVLRKRRRLWSWEATSRRCFHGHGRKPGHGVLRRDQVNEDGGGSTTRRLTYGGGACVV